MDDQKHLSSRKFFYFSILFSFFVSATLSWAYPGSTQLDPNFYDRTCPMFAVIVRFNMWAAMQNDNRIAASILRLHFHDCIVQGCDASLLLDDTDEFEGEKNAGPNLNSLRGFDVIETIKEEVERACPLTVSCADILTLAAREATIMSGGPSWPLKFGRRDSLKSSKKQANMEIPSPFDSLENITKKFASKGLDVKDVVALSGAHTIGFAHCFFVGKGLNFDGNGKPASTAGARYLATMRRQCPNTSLTNPTLAPLDWATTYKFDNAYYKNLKRKQAFLTSDQVLMTDRNTAAMVDVFSRNPAAFFRQFAASMTKLSNAGVLTGGRGEVREKCGSAN